MRWVIVFWIVGMYPSGEISTSEYQMVMFEPKFEKRSDCELYSIQRRTEWMQSFYEQVTNNTDFSGFELTNEPECKIFNEKTMELIDGGSNI